MFPSSRPFQYTSMKLSIRIPSTYLFHHAYPSDAITKRFNVICHMDTSYQFHHAAPARATPRHSNDLQCHTFQPLPAPSNPSPDLQFFPNAHAQEVRQWTHVGTTFRSTLSIFRRVLLPGSSRPGNTIRATRRSPPRKSE